jgi:hypothetical protein
MLVLPAYLVRIEAKHFTAGIIMTPDDRVYKAAPILYYMSNWTLDQIEDYCKKKNWKMEIIP